MSSRYRSPRAQPHKSDTWGNREYEPIHGNSPYLNALTSWKKIQRRQPNLMEKCTKCTSSCFPRVFTRSSWCTGTRSPPLAAWGGVTPSRAAKPVSALGISRTDVHNTSRTIEVAWKFKCSPKDFKYHLSGAHCTGTRDYWVTFIPQHRKPQAAFWTFRSLIHL